jgi:hypothetical protein
VHVIDLDQPDTSAIVQASKQRGVKARRQLRRYGSLEVIAWRKTRRRGAGPAAVQSKKKSRYS